MKSQTIVNFFNHFSLLLLISCNGVFCMDQKDFKEEPKKQTAASEIDWNQFLADAIDETEKEDVIKALANGASSAKRFRGFTPLERAVNHDSPEIVRLLIKNQANANDID